MTISKSFPAAEDKDTVLYELAPVGGCLRFRSGTTRARSEKIGSTPECQTMLKALRRSSCSVLSKFRIIW